MTEAFKFYKNDLNKMLKVGIIGATGYVGAELIRLLLNHPKVKLEAISSVSYTGEDISSIYKNFYGKINLICTDMKEVIKIQI